LEDCRLKFDLICCYKIIFGLVRVNHVMNFFELATSRTTGHPFKLYKRFCSSSARSLFFSERLINCWNQLPNSVDFNSLYKFQNSLDAIDYLLVKLTSLMCFYVFFFFFKGSCRCRWPYCAVEHLLFTFYFIVPLVPACVLK